MHFAERVAGTDPHRLRNRAQEPPAPGGGPGLGGAELPASCLAWKAAVSCPWARIQPAVSLGSELQALWPCGVSGGRCLPPESPVWPSATLLGFTALPLHSLPALCRVPPLWHWPGKDGGDQGLGAPWVLAEGTEPERAEPPLGDTEIRGAPGSDSRHRLHSAAGSASSGPPVALPPLRGPVGLEAG